VDKATGAWSWLLTSI